LKVVIDLSTLYDSRHNWTELSRQLSANGYEIVWTKDMKRLFSLTSEAIQAAEPFLLVGETGIGK
jgi:midasin (ATPase involved in ribosome maturation)